MIFQILKSILILAGTITGVSIAYSLIDKYPQAVNELIPWENPHFILAGLLLQTGLHKKDHKRI